MRYRLDRRAKRFGDLGRIVLGGDPTGLFRLSAGGARALDIALIDSPAVSGSGKGSAADELVGRLVERGVLHPAPERGEGPFTAGDVTVVVPVRNNAAGVARLLESLEGDSGLSAIVVDDGSTDAGALVVTALESEVAQRLIHMGDSQGPAAARNRGAGQARTALIAFVDSDCVVSPGWLDGLLGHFTDPAVAAVAPRIAASCTNPRTERERMAAVIEAHEAHRSPLDLGPDPASVRPGTRVGYVPSAALVIRASAFSEIGGFDEALRTGEDVDLIWRLVGSEHTVRYEPMSTVHHTPRSSTAAFTRQRFGYGRSAAALDRRHSGQVAPARLSRWSVAVAALLLIGGPGVPLAVALAGWTTSKLRDQLDGVPSRDVMRIGFGGHWAAIRQLLRASIRVWWPIIVPASLVSRRARRVLGVALVLALVEARRDGVPTAALLLALLDDISYGAGVWRGCIDERSLRALLPDLAN